MTGSFPQDPMTFVRTADRISLRGRGRCGSFPLTSLASRQGRCIRVGSDLNSGLAGAHTNELIGW